MTEQAPLTRKLEANHDALGAAVTGTTTVGEAPFAGTVTSVTYVPRADIVGADTNTRTLTLVNKGLDGNGTTVVATLALNAAAGTKADFDEHALTLSVVAGATTVAEGDILTFVSTHAASGLADPGGKVQVEVSRS